MISISSALNRSYARSGPPLVFGPRANFGMSGYRALRAWTAEFVLVRSGGEPSIPEKFDVCRSTSSRATKYLTHSELARLLLPLVATSDLLRHSPVLRTCARSPICPSSVLGPPEALREARLTHTREPGFDLCRGTSRRRSSPPAKWPAHSVS